jgi:hypothetical protein
MMEIQPSVELRSLCASCYIWRQCASICEENPEFQGHMTPQNARKTRSFKIRKRGLAHSFPLTAFKTNISIIFMHYKYSRQVPYRPRQRCRHPDQPQQIFYKAQASSGQTFPTP